MTKKLMMLLCAVAMTAPQGVFALQSRRVRNEQTAALTAATAALAEAAADAQEATATSWKDKARSAYGTATTKLGGWRDQLAESRFGKAASKYGRKAWDNKGKIAALIALLGLLARQNDAVNNSRWVPGTRVRNALFPKLGLQMPHRAYTDGAEHEAVYNPFPVRENAGFYESGVSLKGRAADELAARKALWDSSEPGWNKTRAALSPFSVQES